jgi:acyl-CoA synthetase (AMP-forming)/AMP-acid ligase II
VLRLGAGTRRSTSTSPCSTSTARCSPAPASRWCPKASPISRAEAGARPTLLELKGVCAARLLRYMIVDMVPSVEALPRTPNGKIDRRALAAAVEAAA